MTHTPATVDDAALSPLDARYVGVLRIRAALWAAVLVAAAIIVDSAAPLVAGVLTLPALLGALVLVVVLPRRQYRRWGYRLDGDRLRVVQGLVVVSDAVVPFSRVQHIDVRQGPLERLRGLGQLTLYTAGTHNSSVSLPGLSFSHAMAMREAIRAYIRQDAA